MSRATVIARREFSSYFHSPIAYVAMTLFLFASGLLVSQGFSAGTAGGAAVDLRLDDLAARPDCSNPEHGPSFAGMGYRND